jgi:hypothetical protein
MLSLNYKDMRSKDIVGELEGRIKFWKGLYPLRKLLHRNRISFKKFKNGMT